MEAVAREIKASIRDLIALAKVDIIIRLTLSFFLLVTVI